MKYDRGIRGKPRERIAPLTIGADLETMERSTFHSVTILQSNLIRRSTRCSREILSVSLGHALGSLQGYKAQKT